MTLERLIYLLKETVKAKTLKYTASELGVSPAYLHDVINGRRYPGKSILSPLGLKKVIYYESK